MQDIILFSFNKEKNMREMTDKICTKIIGQKCENFDKLMAQYFIKNKNIKIKF